MLEQKITLNRTTKKIAEAFGVSPERKAEILKKLIAVAKIYPRYSIIAEVLLNCEDRFTEKERLYGLLELGKIKGFTEMMKQTNIKIKCDTRKMSHEQELLSILSKRFTVAEDSLFEKLLGRG